MITSKKLNILYLLYFDLENTKLLGVKKKIIGQSEALRKLGNNVDIGYCSENQIIIKSKDRIDKYVAKEGVTNYRKSVYMFLKDKKNSAKYDVIYVRLHASVDYYLYKTAMILNKYKVKFILELPTYPIKGELQSHLKDTFKNKSYFKFLKASCRYFLHNIFKGKLYKTDVKIVTYMPYKKIWNIDTIIIDNGIDTGKIKYIESYNRNYNIFNMLIVANMEKWHGIDRMIYGIKNFIQQNDHKAIKLTIVGDGSVREELEKIVKVEGLSDYIKFEGMLEGEKLNKLYEEANIAIGSLALHRIGLQTGSTLKVKEYCAKGIPFILGYKEKKIDEKFKYAYYVPANEEPIDISKCITFYEKIKDKDYRKEMYNFAKENYDWKIQMKKMLDNL